MVCLSPTLHKSLVECTRVQGTETRVRAVRCAVNSTPHEHSSAVSQGCLGTVFQIPGLHDEAQVPQILMGGACPGPQLLAVYIQSDLRSPASATSGHTLRCI